MTLQSSGQISLSQVNTELGNASTTQIALGQATVRTLAGIASGQISLSSLYGKSAGPPVQGQQVYSIPGGYNWIVPTGVTSVSVLCVGGGQSGAAIAYGGEGGSLAYKNNIAVTPGTAITVVVGQGGQYTNSSVYSRASGGHSYFSTINTVYARGGGQAGVNYGDVSYLGGAGGTLGGGGAAGYSGPGGAGGGVGANGANGQGGGGGGGASGYVQDDTDVNGSGSYLRQRSGAGGGVGIVGIGSNGVGGSIWGGQGGGGSGGTAGTTSTVAGGFGGIYGGGGGAGYYSAEYLEGTPVYEDYDNYGGSGGNGVVRIMWGGGRSYPSNAADVAPTGTPLGNYTFAVLSGTSAPYTANYVTTLPTGVFTSGVQVVTNVSAVSALQVGTTGNLNYTITAWVYLTSNNPVNSVIIDAPYTVHGPPYYSYHLRLTNGQLFFGYNRNGSYFNLDTGGVQVPYNQWTHVALSHSFSGLYLRYYVDGVQQNATSPSSTPIQYYAAPLTIGQAPNWGGLFQGKIGMVRLYKDKAFTNAEVLADYQAGFSG